MDFETFGEHQWAETGIFEFFAGFVDHFLRRAWNSFKTPTELLTRPHHQVHSRGQFRSLKDLPVYDVPIPISWADVDRDLTAWLENDLQQDTIHQLYALRPSVQKQQNPELEDIWRRLQISDHFYYMCTKWAADGDVHAYFSPYKSPYEAYRRYSIVLADLKEKISAKAIH
jgi:alpha-amylase